MDFDADISNAPPNVRALIRHLRERAEAAESQVQELSARVHDLAGQLEVQERVAEALMKQIGSLTRRLAKGASRPEQLALEFELTKLQHRLDDLNNDKFGRRSERRGRPEGVEPKEKKRPKTKRRSGPTPQPDLPRDEQLHLLDEPDQRCKVCPSSLQPIEGCTDDGEVITVVERTFKITLHRQQVYKCPRCGDTDMALGPAKLSPNARYSPEFAVTVATDKYRDHLPLARQVKRMKESGLVATSQTLWDQIALLYKFLLPTLLALHDRILSSPVVYADETSWRLMGRGRNKKWWVWLVTDGTGVFFLMAPTRGNAAGRELLKDYGGVVMADRYAVYVSLEKNLSRNGGVQQVIDEDGNQVEVYTPDYVLVACWMHCRRGFVKAARSDDRANRVLNLIPELFAIEAEANEAVAEIEDEDERYAQLLDQRHELRTQRSAAVVAELKAWSESVTAMPNLPLAGAIDWMNNGWEQLTRFLTDPRVPLDNGLSER